MILHITAENHVRTGGICRRSVAQKLKRKLSIVDNHESLAQHSYRADGAVKILMFCPVVAFEHARFGQIIDVSKKRETFGTWR